MSIRRIESAYATYLDDKRLSGTEMAVLIALSYVANERRNEDCYPSDGYLEKLTHFKPTAIKNARTALKKLNVIDWVSGGKSREGGNVSNRYRFLFPHAKMPSWRERYQPIVESPTPPCVDPTARDAVPSAVSRPTLRYETPTNSGKIPKGTSESKSEPAVVSDSGVFDGIFGQSVSFKPKPERQYSIAVQMALRACKVSDDYNANSFRKVIDRLNPDVAADEIYAFESEIRQGEHDGAENLAAVLMARLQARSCAGVCILGHSANP